MTGTWMTSASGRPVDTLAFLTAVDTCLSAVPADTVLVSVASPVTDRRGVVR